MNYVLAIDQGTTSSRAILFDQNLNASFISQKEFPQRFPKPGCVEHDPADIWNSVLSVCNSVIKDSSISINEVESSIIPKPVDFAIVIGTSPSTIE